MTINNDTLYLLSVRLPRTLHHELSEYALMHFDLSQLVRALIKLALTDACFVPQKWARDDSLIQYGFRVSAKTKMMVAAKLIEICESDKFLKVNADDRKVTQSDLLRSALEYGWNKLYHDPKLEKTLHTFLGY